MFPHTLKIKPNISFSRGNLKAIFESIWTFFQELFNVDTKFSKIMSLIRKVQGQGFRSI